MATASWKPPENEAPTKRVPHLQVQTHGGDHSEQDSVSFLENTMYYWLIVFKFFIERN